MGGGKTWKLVWSGSQQMGTFNLSQSCLGKTMFLVDKNNNSVMYSSAVPPIGNVSITTTHTGGDSRHALLISKDGMSFSTISAQFTCAYIYLMD